MTVSKLGTVKLIRAHFKLYQYPVPTNSCSVLVMVLPSFVCCFECNDIHCYSFQAFMCILFMFHLAVLNSDFVHIGEGWGIFSLQIEPFQHISCYNILQNIVITTQVCYDVILMMLQNYAEYLFGFEKLLTKAGRRSNSLKTQYVHKIKLRRITCFLVTLEEQMQGQQNKFSNYTVSKSW